MATIQNGHPSSSGSPQTAGPEACAPGASMGSPPMILGPSCGTYPKVETKPVAIRDDEHKE